jgi:hypothetical protein
MLVFGAAATAAMFWLMWTYRAYYFLPMSERPLSAAHELLRSSGRAGLSMGLAGTVLIFLNLGYLLRRLAFKADWAGSLRSWMAFHVFTGIVGPLLILAHSTFVLRSALATIAALALVVVVITGIVGRYIYARTPRSVQGKELELGDLGVQLDAHRAELRKLGLEMGDSAIPHEPPAYIGTFAAMKTLIRGEHEARAELQELRRSVRASEKLAPTADQILPVAERYLRERRWLTRYHERRALMANWRFFHRWFAIVMLIIAAFHVLIFLRLGGGGAF